MRPRTVVVAAGCVLLFAMSARAETPPPPAEGPVGRYQLTISGASVYVVDTTNGHCWSKLLDEPWVDLGKPMQPIKPKVEKPLALQLPHDKVELTIKQRRSAPIPGSDGQVSIYIDDITGGQVVVSIHTNKGKELLNDVSVKPGDIVDFEVGDKKFHVRLKELRNFLTGGDVATLQISADRELLAREPKPASLDEPKADSPKKDSPKEKDKVDPPKAESRD